MEIIRKDKKGNGEQPFLITGDAVIPKIFGLFLDLL